LVGQKENPLSKTDGSGFYAKVDNPKIEIGFLSLTEGETITEVPHIHPECIEAFIVLKGRVAFDVQGKEVILDSGSPYYLVFVQIHNINLPRSSPRQNLLCLNEQ
jgi:mannose-6-phosphate isomerase-like protein (cupin superfamily)